MAIKLLPATTEDSPEMMDVGMAAFAEDKLSNAIFHLKTATPEQLLAYKNWRIELSRLRMTGPGKHWIKAVDDSNNSIVGFIGLYDPHVVAPEHSEVSKPENMEMNHEIENEVMSKLKMFKEKYVGQRSDVWYIQSMVVRPDYQGRNIATELLQRGLEEADKAGQDVYLEGTAAGLRLYRRCNFEELDEIDMETVDYKLESYKWLVSGIIKPTLAA